MRLLLRRRNALLTAVAVIVLTNQFYVGKRLQRRSRVASTKAAKPTITAAAISIQFWASIPRIVKCPVRNCTLPIPFLVQPTRFARENILFLYLDWASLADSVERSPQLADQEAMDGEAVENGGRALAACRWAPGRATLRCRGWSKRRAELEQPIELMRVVAASVGSGDEHLPALIDQGVCLGDRHSDAQAHRGGDSLALGRVDNEGHDGTGKPLAVQRRHRASFVPWDVPKDC